MFIRTVSPPVYPHEKQELMSAQEKEAEFFTTKWCVITEEDCPNAKRDSLHGALRRHLSFPYFSKTSYPSFQAANDATEVLWKQSSHGSDEEKNNIITYFCELASPDEIENFSRLNLKDTMEESGSSRDYFYWPQQSTPKRNSCKNNHVLRFVWEVYEDAECEFAGQVSGKSESESQLAYASESGTGGKSENDLACQGPHGHHVKMESSCRMFTSVSECLKDFQLNCQYDRYDISKKWMVMVQCIPSCHCFLL